MTNIEIEQIENKYLNKYYHFLKFAEDELLYGFKTKSKIENDWLSKYKSGISDFSTGAERIVYSLLNGKGIGQPNSCPVGSDLFFEVKDAYIHIDLKTVGATLNPKKKDVANNIPAWSNNINDYTKNIFVGRNQNSYKGMMEVHDKKTIIYRAYEPSLPTFYNKGTSEQKICLSYFITILYDKDTLDTLVMSIICMPNGELEKHYGKKVLQAGKNLDKTRFRFIDIENFELLGNKKRVKVVYFQNDMNEKYKKKLDFFNKLHNKQKDSENDI